MPKIITVDHDQKDWRERFTEREAGSISTAIHESHAVYYILDDDGAPLWSIVDLRPKSEADIRKLAELAQVIGGI